MQSISASSRLSRSLLIAALALLALGLLAVVALVAFRPPSPQVTSRQSQAAPTALIPSGVGTSIAGPVSTSLSTFTVPDAVATSEYIKHKDDVPTPTPTPTWDPRIPTFTPTYTPLPTFTPTPTPPLAPLTDSIPDPHQPGVQYFPATGHTLRGPFLDYWNQHGGLAQFGNPITEEFVEAEDPNANPLEVQYFEQVRIEHSIQPTTPATVRVSGPLDQIPGRRARPVTATPTPTATPYVVNAHPLGIELAKQKGYFNGKYPLYGRAADFSWVSGRLQSHYPRELQSLAGGCSKLQYEVADPSAVMQLEGPTWRTYEDSNFLSVGTFMVAFGGQAGDKMRSICLGTPKETVFGLDRLYLVSPP
jgi:hypothetical protein